MSAAHWIAERVIYLVATILLTCVAAAFINWDLAALNPGTWDIVGRLMAMIFGVVGAAAIPECVPHPYRLPQLIDRLSERGAA